MIKGPLIGISDILRARTLDRAGLAFIKLHGSMEKLQENLQLIHEAFLTFRPDHGNERRVRGVFKTVDTILSVYFLYLGL